MKSNIYMSGAASLALIAGMSAQAQETRSPGAAEPVEEIVVIGARLQNKRAVEEKRASDVIADFITSDDVGALPDFSVADALTRIAGVSTEDRNGDSEFIVIRGLRSDFNFLSIDGAIVPSTRTNGRATQLSVIPSYVIDVSSVKKSFTADLDANTIGGHVEVRTRSAFDYDEVYFAARGALGFSGHNDSPGSYGVNNRADLAFASTFGSDDQFGLVLSGSYLDSGNDTWLPGVSFNEYEFWDPSNPDDGAARETRLEDAAPGAVQVPHGAQLYQYTNEIERIGGFAKLEWQPFENFYSSLSGYWFREEDVEQRWDNLVFRNRRGNRPLDLTETSGLAEEGRVYNQYFLQGDTNTLRSATFRADWTPMEDHDINFLASYADGERENPFYQVRFNTTTANEDMFAFRYDSSGEYPVIDFANPENFTDLSLYTPVFYRPRFDINEQEAVQFKLDYGYNWGGGDIGLGVKLGAGYRTDTRKQDQLFDNDFRPDSDATRAFTFDNAVLGFTNTFDPDLLPGLPQQFIDEDAFLNFFEATQGEWDDRKTPENEALSSEFEVEEEITAAYFMARYVGDAFNLTAGVRYEDTETTSSGFRFDGGLSEFVFVAEEGNYDNFLPSASLIVDVTNNLRFRAAYSRTLGRAEYDDLSVLGSQEIDDAMQTISISSGNPNLLPRISDNFDVSVEYYLPAVEGAISVGFFHKDIENEIFTRSFQREIDIDGVLFTESRRQPASANTASLTGIEAGVTINTFEWLTPMLRDVGVTANYAYIDSSFTIEESEGVERELSGLLFQPSNTANVSAFWAPGDFEFRVAWRHRDSYLISVSSSSPTFDEYIGDQNWVDVQARYKLPYGFTAFVEARNLNNGAQDRLLSYGRTKWTRDFGRSVWAGLIYKY